MIETRRDVRTDPGLSSCRLTVTRLERFVGETRAAASVDVDGALEAEPEVARIDEDRGSPGLRAGRIPSRLADPFRREVPWTLTNCCAPPDDPRSSNRCRHLSWRET